MTPIRRPGRGRYFLIAALSIALPWLSLQAPAAHAQVNQVRVDFGNAQTLIPIDEDECAMDGWVAMEANFEKTTTVSSDENGMYWFVAAPCDQWHWEEIDDLYFAKTVMGMRLPDILVETADLDSLDRVAKIEFFESVMVTAVGFRFREMLENIYRQSGFTIKAVKNSVLGKGPDAIYRSGLSQTALPDGESFTVLSLESATMIGGVYVFMLENVRFRNADQLDALYEARRRQIAEMISINEGPETNPEVRKLIEKMDRMEKTNTP